MKPIHKMTACLLLLVVPALLRADSSADRKIEAAAKDSYNYRTVLEDHVKIKVNDGIVTLSGTVPDADQRALAEDTVRNLPGVVQVDNRIKVEGGAAEHSDAWISTKIHSKLLVSKNVSTVNTKVDVRDGVVTLTGKADNMAQKELTTAIVKDIEGVRSVNNEITVVDVPAGKADKDYHSVDNHPVDNRTAGEHVDDASITAQVKYALLTHKSTSALKTNVTTKEGVVVIEGDASSDAEKSLVTHLAEGVRGVRDVNNRMNVKG
jgi:osmotically-inducible protein OsmY